MTAKLFIPEDELTDRERAALRSCGECYACCKWLGIEALRKYPGQSCTKLDGALGATTRCSIYSSRPEACAKFSCGWRSGLGTDDLRPDRSGVMIVVYPNSLNPDLLLAATITVIDPAKGGSVDSGNLGAAVDLCVNKCDMDDVRVVHYASRTVLHFFRGNIFRGQLLKSDCDGFEQLKFITFEPPIGRYERERTDA